jgi:hypothetical protein
VRPAVYRGPIICCWDDGREELGPASAPPAEGLAAFSMPSCAAQSDATRSSNRCVSFDGTQAACHGTEVG